MVNDSETDAQMCLYHVSWQSNFGFCCVLDDESMEELVCMYLFRSLATKSSFCVLFLTLDLYFCAAVPGVLSVQTDEHFESENKDYGGLYALFNFFGNWLIVVSCWLF